VLFAACRPDRFTVADSRALQTLRGQQLMPPGPLAFPLGDWLPDLDTRRMLAWQFGLSLPSGRSLLDRRIRSAPVQRLTCRLMR
jgi:hypothetical protein